MRSPLALLLLVFAMIGSAPTLAQTDRQTGIAEFLAAFRERGNLRGSALAIVDGETVFDSAFGLANAENGRPNSTDTRFYAASVTKAFTAVAILQLAEAGALRLDAPIADYLSGFDPEIGATVTVRHLLNHSSGILRDYTERLPEGAIGTDRQLIDSVNGSGLMFDPGSSIAYSNTGYRILALMIERVTNMPFAEVIHHRIFVPADMPRSTIGLDGVPAEQVARGYQRPDLVTPRPTLEIEDDLPAMRGAGGLYTTTHDLVNFVAALRAGVLISPESLETMLQPPSIGDDPTDVMGWEIMSLGEMPIVLGSGASSGYLAFLIWPRDGDDVVAVLSNDTSLGRVGGRALAFGLIRLLSGANAPAIPETPLADFLYVLQSEGIASATDFARTIDPSGAPIENAAASQALGPPDGGIGESQRAWAPATADAGLEWLELDYRTPVRATGIMVQYTQVPGAMTGIGINDGSSLPLDAETAQSRDGAPIERYALRPAVEVSRVRLQLDTASVDGWPQIDAVALVDEDGEPHWADRATASSSAYMASAASAYDHPTPDALARLAMRLEEAGRTDDAAAVREAANRLAE